MCTMDFIHYYDYFLSNSPLCENVTVSQKKHRNYVTQKPVPQLEEASLSITLIFHKRYGGIDS